MGMVNSHLMKIICSTSNDCFPARRKVDQKQDDVYKMQPIDDHGGTENSNHRCQNNECRKGRIQPSQRINGVKVRGCGEDDAKQSQRHYLSVATVV